MSDNFKILKNYLLYFLLMILVCIIGISNVFADSYTVIGDKADITVVLVSTNYGNAPFNVPKNSGYNFNEVLQIDYLVSNYNFEANKHYQLESHLSAQTLTNANYYTVTGLNGENCLISYENSIFIGDYPRWDFQCPHSTNSITLSISNSSHSYLWSGSGIYNWQSALLSWSATPIQGSGSDTDNIINNQNQNTQNIINNQNQNTQDIINNQNQNTLEQIESQLVCNDTIIDKSLIFNDSSWLNINGQVLNYGDWGITDYLLINNSVNLIVYSPYDDTTSTASCFYDSTKTLINCFSNSNLNTGQIISVPNNAKFIRFTINIRKNIPMFRMSVCKNGNQALNDSISGLNDSLNDDDSSGATSEASEFFSSFTTNTFGLTSIITAPLNLIQSLSSSTCSELHLPLPYLNNKYLDLPCMTSIYQSHFGAFFTMYQTITYGIIAYWVCVRIFNQVKDFKNPEHDEIEVVDL